MDQPLSHSRYGGDGGGRGRGGRGFYRGGGGRGGGRFRRYPQPYHRGGRGRGNKPRGNRFDGGSNLSPEEQMFRQVAGFVSRAGELQNISTNSANLEPVEGTRSVELVAANNINDLAPVLCDPDKLELLFKFPEGSSEQFGKMVHLVVGCAAGLPLQTPVYAALTMSLHELTKETPYTGFASRCISCAANNLGMELDKVMLQGKEQAQATCKAKLILRYLCILGRMNIIKAHEETSNEDPNRLTIVDLLASLVQAAVVAADKYKNEVAAYTLIYLVLASIPYVVAYIPADMLQEKVLLPMESLLRSYKSAFTPGFGRNAILLKEPQFEVDAVEEEEEEDEEEEEEDSGPICDTLQDLFRATQTLAAGSESTRFAIPNDAPWNLLKRKSPVGQQENGEPSQDESSSAISFSGEPLYVQFTKACKSLALLLGNSSEEAKLHCASLDGVVFPRLPIFGSPIDPDDEEDMEELAGKNESLQTYMKDFRLLDRFYLSESVRDCLVSHETMVQPTGLKQGSPKYAAEELLSVIHAFSGEASASGFDYGILETLFALLTQSERSKCLRSTYLYQVILELVRLQPARISPALVIAMNNIFSDYLPALVPDARLALSGWFAFHLSNTDYQWPAAFWSVWTPTVVSDKPTSRKDFLVKTLNLIGESITDPTMLIGKCLPPDSPLLESFLCQSTTTLTDVSPSSPVAEIGREINTLLWEQNADPESLRVLLAGEKAAAAVAGALDYGSGDPDQLWWRTCVAVRIVMDPARQERQRVRQAYTKALEQASADDMEAEETPEDVVTILQGSIQRYVPLLCGAMAKDAESLYEVYKGETTPEDLSLSAQCYLLQQVDCLTGFSRGLLEACVGCLQTCKVVNGMGVLRWLLGGDKDPSTAPVVSTWWKLGSLSFAEALFSLFQAEASAGMVLDGSQLDADTEKLTGVVQEIQSLSQYAIARSCAILEAQDGANEQKKVSPVQTNLVEGTKSLILSYVGAFEDVAVTTQYFGKQFTPGELSELVGSSVISGNELVKLVPESNAFAIEVLRRALAGLC